MKKILATFLFLPVIANAEFFSGNQLLSDMQGSTVEKSVALGYVMGVADTLTNATICPPSSVTAGQVQDLIKIYLEANPALRHFTADSLIRNKLESTWPCQRGRGA
jgi:hypothetical protein